MAQINYPQTNNRFISVSYQSNNYLNEELDNKVKQVIAKTIFDTVPVLKFHSYVHCQIIVEVSATDSVLNMKKIVNALAEPMAANKPALLYSVQLAAISTETPPASFIFVDGDGDMNQRFLDSIEDFFPKKTK